MNQGYLPNNPKILRNKRFNKNSHLVQKIDYRSNPSLLN